MSKGKDIRDILKWTGIIVLGGFLGGGGALLVTDLIDKHYSKMGEGLPLLVDGVHLKQGNHNVVITDQFYKLLSYDDSPQEDIDLAINGIKEAYTTLNYYNQKVKFNLCTTVDEVATNYNIPKVKSVGKNDIPLYITNDILENNKYVMAKTDWNYNTFTYEMKDLSITYRKDFLSAVWKEYETLEETFAPKNSAAYTITVHESMHAMGFAHIDIKDVKSIMQTYVSSLSPKDLTDYDIKLLDKYNVQFYGAQSIFTTNTQSTSSNALNYTTSYATDDYSL